MRYEITTVEAALALLRLNSEWEHPQSYAGFSPDGDFVILTRSRDPAIYCQSNWKEAANLFAACGHPVSAYHEKGRSMLSEAPVDDERQPVYDWRAGHPMVGWVEYLMVRADAPDDVLILAANIVKSVADYPFLNEDAYQQEKLEAIHDFWKGLSERSRYDYAKDIGMSCPGGEDLVLDPDDCPEVMIEFFMEGDEFR